jgi:hypothetical protein
MVSRLDSCVISSCFNERKLKMNVILSGLWVLPPDAQTADLLLASKYSVTGGHGVRSAVCLSSLGFCRIKPVKTFRTRTSVIGFMYLPDFTA